MAKKSGPNWMLLITIFIFLLSVGVVAYKLLESSSSVNCEFNGDEIKVGDSVGENNKKCVCTSEGLLVCEEGAISDTVSESTFLTENLSFSYKFQNTLVSETPSFSNVKTVDVSQSEKKLKVVIEREVWCSEENEAPDQTAYYQIEDNSLQLFTLTAFEVGIYTKNCLVSNTFEFSNLDILVDENFKITYMGEDGSSNILNTCVYNGILYGGNDTFSSQKQGELCSCNNGSVECE